jgi:hypothetical protein
MSFLIGWNKTAPRPSRKNQAAARHGESLVEKAVEVIVGAELGIAQRFGQLAGVARCPATAPAPPPPLLKRPVVMVTGLLMQASSYAPLAQHLAQNPKNGPFAIYSVADGQFHLRTLRGPVMSQEQLKGTKLFAIQYLDPRAAPAEKEPQLAQALRAIGAASGAETIDLVAHSAGCTDTRLHLDRRARGDGAGEPVIGEVVFVGPASHGTFMGNLGDAVGGLAGVHEAGKALEIGSPLVDGLNERWAEQRAQVTGQVTIIAVTGAPTVGQGGISDGDGFMPLDEVSLPDTSTVALRGPDPTLVAHLAETQYTGVIAAMEQALAG